MKKFPWKQTLAAAVLIVASGLYVWHLNSNSSETPVNPNKGTSPQTPGAAATTDDSSTAYADGTYTGSIADAYYGNLQVQTVISGGKITSVTFLQYPNNVPNSVNINNRAMPLLQSEAIQAQSANVDIVSGATQSSTAFEQSLASALSQAQE